MTEQPEITFATADPADHPELTFSSPTPMTPFLADGCPPLDHDVVSVGAVVPVNPDEAPVTHSGGMIVVATENLPEPVLVEPLEP